MRRRRPVRGMWVASLAALAMLAGCGDGRRAAGTADAAATAGATGATDADGLGLTRVGTTEHYLVVLNVVPPEEMYLPAQAAQQHPTGGELILHGEMAPITAQSRHAEAHIYSKETGKPVTDVVPEIEIADQTDGTTQKPEATLMQDVLIGARDIHFGNNAVIKAGHEFSVAVTIGSEAVSFSGRLS